MDTQKRIEPKPRPSVVPYFIGRQDVLDTLRTTYLHDSPSQSDSPIITVLAGLDGSGKSQIALKFASEYEQK
jgi:Holliday junction resolvasome RuvABC ATP-dependent DNA helicase subunit